MKKNASNTASLNTAGRAKTKERHPKKKSAKSRATLRGQKCLNDTTDNRSTNTDLSEGEFDRLRIYQANYEFKYRVSKAFGELASQRLTG